MSSKILLAITTINVVIMAWYISTIEQSVVPIHFGINGIPDGFGSKWFLMIGSAVPIILSICLMIYRSITKNNQNVQYNKTVENRVITAIIVLFIVVGWVITTCTIKENLNTNVFNYIVMLLGILMIYISSIMKNIKPNSTFGIRTPWTLESETVWNKTHRLGYTTGILGGITIILFSCVSIIINIPWLCFIGIFLGVTLCAIVPLVYSYIKRELN